MTFRQLRTQQVNKLQRKHPGTKRQVSSHGADRWSVQFFDQAGVLVADYDLDPAGPVQHGIKPK